MAYRLAGIDAEATPLLAFFRDYAYYAWYHMYPFVAICSPMQPPSHDIPPLRVYRLEEALMMAPDTWARKRPPQVSFAI